MSRADGTPLAVAVSDLSVRFGAVQALSGITLDIPTGRLVAIIGPNGSGKTTLVRCLVGLQELTSGSVRLLGEARLSDALRRVGYVPQRLSFERGFPLSVREFLALRLASTRHWFWMGTDRVDEALGEHMPDLGVLPLLGKPVASLSGGQMQRVLIAFALLQRPELLVLDEPTAGVDTPGEQSFYELIAEVHRSRGLTVILVSHDLSMVYRHASWVYAINGVLCCQGPPDEVMNTESLKKAYGIHLTSYHHHG